jgi:hypothetical protein
MRKQILSIIFAFLLLGSISSASAQQVILPSNITGIIPTTTTIPDQSFTFPQLDADTVIIIEIIVVTIVIILVIGFVKKMGHDSAEFTFNKKF